MGAGRTGYGDGPGAPHVPLPLPLPPTPALAPGAEASGAPQMFEPLWGAVLGIGFGGPWAQFARGACGAGGWKPGGGSVA